jgi:hypothetical protein
MLTMGNISPHDLDLITLADTEEEVVEIIDTFYKERIFSPNF